MKPGARQPVRHAIGIDLGGTNLRGALVSEEGEVEARFQLSSFAKRGHEAVLDMIAAQIAQLNAAAKEQGKHPVGVGIGIPGIFDPLSGVLHRSPHFASWRDIPLRALAAKKVDLPVHLDNDANMAGLGEVWKGIGQRKRNFVLLTLGTGVGGAIVLDHKLWRGDSGFAGEVGHMVINPEGPVCSCGGRGCWEMYVSATGLKHLVDEADDGDAKAKFRRWFKKDFSIVTPADLHNAALDGDIFANTTFKKMGYYLAIGISSLMNTLGVHTIVIGGNVSRAWDFFITELRHELPRRIYKETARRVEIIPASFGDNAGILGAAYSVFSSSRPLLQ